MESGAEELLPLGHIFKRKSSLEVEDIHDWIETLSSEEKVQLVRKMVVAMTKSEMAFVLDEIAIRLRNTDDQ